MELQINRVQIKRSRPVLYSKELTTAKKVTPVGLDLMQEIITGLGVKCLTICAKLACAI